MARRGGSSWACTRLKGKEEKGTKAWCRGRSSQPLTKPGELTKLIR